MTDQFVARPAGRIPERCRIAVVGSGLAGLGLARELADLGADGVVVFEAGPDRGSEHKETLSRDQSMHLWHVADPDFHRGWDSALPPHYVHSSGLRKRVGGRSLYWHGVCVRIEDAVLRSGVWPEELSRALLDEGAPDESLYTQVAARLGSWVGAPLDHCRGPRERWLLGLLRRHGYRVQPTPQAARPGDAYGPPSRQVPFTPLTHWNGPDPSPLGYPVIPDCPVSQVRSRSDGLVEVVVGQGGRARVVVAEQVVLAAGTFENTRLVGRLLADRHGCDSWEFGNLTDHVNQGFLAVVDRAGLPLPPEPGRAFCMAPALDTCQSNLFFDVMDAPHPDRVLMCVWTMGEQHSAESRVIVTRGPSPESPDASATPDSSDGWRLHVVPVISQGDELLIARQAEQLAEVAARVFGIRSRYPVDKETFRLGRPLFLEQLRAALAHNPAVDGNAVFPYVYPLGSVDHEAGTLAMGGAEVDDEGRLRELPRVSVLGPSAFPRQGAANPSLTTLALAKWYARRLCGA